MESSSPSPGPADYRPPVDAQVIQPPRRLGFFARLLLVIVVLGLAGSIFVNFLLAGMLGLSEADSEGRVEEKFYSHERTAHQKVAVLSVEGAIISEDGFIKHQIDRALKDENVKAVVLRINSPGGTVAASDFLYHYLGKLTKKGIPIVVSMGGIAASGGYYMAMAVGDEPRAIYAEPATWTGSIGVVIPHYNLAELMDRIGIKEDSIASHRLKTMGSFTKPMTEEERKIFQGLVDASFTRFKDIVKSGRPKLRKQPQELDKLATGQVFTSQQAKDAGLIDEIGFLDDAVNRAIELAQLDSNETRVVRYRKPQGLGALLLGTDARAGRFDLAEVLQLATPRAYYLFTWPTAEKQ